MELRHLRYFVAVAEELNFRKAAERLNITRPALSKQVRDLEGEIGVSLLVRNTAHVALTDAGRAYLLDARAILEQVDRAATTARDVQSGRRGHLLIASPGPMAAGFMPEALKSFGEQFPHIDIGFVEKDPHEQFKALLDGSIHIGFAYGKRPVLPRNLKSARILQTRMAVALYREHRLAQKDSIDLRELRGETLLCFGRESNSKHCSDIKSLFATEGVPHGPTRYIQGYDALLTMIAANQGVALLPRVLDLHRFQGIIVKPLIALQAELGFSMWAVWKSGEPSPLVANFLSRLRERMPVPFKRKDVEGAA